jgi:hypothetical protein
MRKKVGHIIFRLFCFLGSGIMVSTERNGWISDSQQSGILVV